MIINDQRKHLKVVPYEDLIPGNIYVDVYANYVIATDSESLLDLVTGEGYGYAHYQNKVDEFIILDAELVIK